MRPGSGAVSAATIDVAVVGGGISGLALAFWLRRTAPSLSVRVFERDPVPGGKLRSTVADGAVFDWGPNGVLMIGAPDTVEMIDALGLEGELRRADPLARRRFLYVDGLLRTAPTSPASLLRSDLLSTRAKARVALETLRRRPRPAPAEETVHAFLLRHFGSEAADLLGPALATGVTAGDPRRLSLDAAFPRLRALERSHGSVVRGMVAAAKAARSTGSRADTRLHSFRGGIGALSTALATALSTTLTTGVEIDSLSPTAQGFELRSARGDELVAGQVVLAAPAHHGAALLAPFAANAAESLRAIPAADVGVFGLTYPRDAVPHPLDGFGVLVAPQEEVRILGVQFTSTLFPEQSPTGTVNLRVICGGTLDPDFLASSDAEALQVVKRGLRRILGIAAEPSSVHYTRWPRGIPQYNLGHSALVQKARRALEPWPGLHLTGNSYDGVAVNDCLRNARHLAAALATGAASFVRTEAALSSPRAGAA